MDSLYNRATTAAAFLKTRFNPDPLIGVLTGTGLGDSLEALEMTGSCDYRQVPHFPVSTVTGHPGRLLFGTMAGHTLMVMQGRIHLYEGYSPQEVTFPIRVMQELGVRVLIVTNAAGGLNPKFAPGDIMLVNDHINLTGENPLIGPNEDRWGIRFPDMTRAYDPDLAGLCLKSAAETEHPLRQGVYGGLKGPSLETPAEVRMLKTIGVDAVGFSTVQETIVAVHAGMKVLALSTITNVNDPDRPVPATLEDIINVAATAAPQVGRIIAAAVEKIDAEQPG